MQPLNNLDPYAKAQSQTIQTKEYRYGSGQTIFSMFFLFGFLIGSLLLIWGVLFSEIGAIYMGGILTLTFGLGVITRNKSFQCNLEGIKASYWFRPAKELTWEEIIGLEIRLSRGRWCYVKTHHQSIVFPIDDIYGLEDKSILIKTILERAHLKLMKKSFWGNLVYRRSEILE